MKKMKRIIPLILALSLMLGAVVVSAEVSAPDTILYGDPDQNGTINAKDAMLVLQMYTGKVDSKFYPEDRCDVDNNGSTNAKDAMLILQKYTGKIEVFPVCHDWDDWKVEVKPTETETGIGYRFCKGCHLKETKELPVAESTEPAEHEHEWVFSEYVGPYACREGYNVYTCACGESYTKGTGDVLECAWEAIEVVAPTTEEMGYTVYKCSVCGNTWTDYDRDKLPAETEPVETEPTPTEPAECTNHEASAEVLASVENNYHDYWNAVCKCGGNYYEWSYNADTREGTIALIQTHIAEREGDGKTHGIRGIGHRRQYDCPPFFDCIHCGTKCIYTDYYDWCETVAIEWFD